MKLDFLINFPLIYYAYILLKLSYKVLILEEVIIIKYKKMFIKISLFFLCTFSIIYIDGIISYLAENTDDSLFSKIFTVLFFSAASLALPLSFVYFSKEQKNNYSIIGIEKNKLYPILKEHLDAHYKNIEYKDNSASLVNNDGFEIGINYFKIKNINEDNTEELLKSLEDDYRLRSLLYKIIGIVLLLLGCFIGYESIIEIIKSLKEVLL